MELHKLAHSNGTHATFNLIKKESLCCCCAACAVLYKAVVRTGADGTSSMQVTVTLGSDGTVMGPTRLNSDVGEDKEFPSNSVKEFYFIGAAVDTTGAPMVLSVWYEGSGYVPFDTWRMTAINITNMATGHTWVYGGFVFTEQARQTTLQPRSEQYSGMLCKAC